MNMPTQSDVTARIRVGVSACLLGAEVRFDGGHKRDRFVDGLLAGYFEFVPVCPEVAIGLGTPRQPIRLVAAADGPRAVGTREPGRDVTGALRDYGAKVARDNRDLCGFVFKKGSPSCGMERVRVYNDSGLAQRDGVGLFAAQIMQANPLLPVEEEGRLNDPVLRENFINRVFVYARWQALQAAGLDKAGLVAFHAAHKLLVMAHSNLAYRELGRLVADLDGAPLERLAERYFARLMQALGERATRKRHSNVLYHLLGYLRRQADAGDRADVLDAIEAYRRGEFPLVVPVQLLRHQFRRHPHPYVNRQVYLSPYPAQLMLRNGI